MPITIKNDGLSILVLPDSSDFSDQLHANWFDAEYWRKQNKISGESKGRHTTWFVKSGKASHFEEQQWALRHYFRGGLIAKFITDSFLFTGIKNTRAYREVLLLKTMKNLGLPVPRVIGAQVVRKGLFYSADLLTEKLEGSDLVTQLKVKPLSKENWYIVGKVIGKFHQHGIYHSDLNSHNIMIQEKAHSTNVWLIDFDKCEQRTVKKLYKNSWKNDNITRLYRSLVKEKGVFPSINFDEGNWSELVRGYNSAL